MLTSIAIRILAKLNETWIDNLISLAEDINQVPGFRRVRGSKKSVGCTCIIMATRAANSRKLKLKN